MSERCWKFVSVKFAWRGLLVGALCLAPGAWAQGQARTRGWRRRGTFAEFFGGEDAGWWCG